MRCRVRTKMGGTPLMLRSKGCVSQGQEAASFTRIHEDGVGDPFGWLRAGRHWPTSPHDRRRARWPARPVGAQAAQGFCWRTSPDLSATPAAAPRRRRIYRKQIRPILVAGAETMDEIFTATGSDPQSVAARVRAVETPRASVVSWPATARDHPDKTALRPPAETRVHDLDRMVGGMSAVPPPVPVI